MHDIRGALKSDDMRKVIKDTMKDMVEGKTFNAEVRDAVRQEVGEGIRAIIREELADTAEGLREMAAVVERMQDSWEEHYDGDGQMNSPASSSRWERPLATPQTNRSRRSGLNN